MRKGRGGSSAVSTWWAIRLSAETPLSLSTGQYDVWLSNIVGWRGSGLYQGMVLIPLPKVGVTVKAEDGVEEGGEERVEDGMHKETQTQTQNQNLNLDWRKKRK